jgi:transposase
MTDGRLWLLRDAYTAETAWAPRHVGKELRLSRLGAFDAGLGAIRADAETAAARKAGDRDRAGRHETLAASYRALRDIYQQRQQAFAQAMADRREWERATEQSRRLAITADAELRRRHPGQKIEALSSAEPALSSDTGREQPVGAENLRHLGRCFTGRRRLGHANGAWRAVWFGLVCDDLRLVGLKLIFLVVTRAVSVLGLSRREAWWKDAEILMLRHQLAVALRERPRAHSRLTWPDRAWLALLAGTLPAERLAGLRLIVTPATIVRWHRDIVRRRWARLSRRGRSGRPPVRRTVRSVVLRLARENDSWGYRRIHGELAALGIIVAPSTVWQILKDAGIDPAPSRDGPGWAEFLRSQAQGILALDFFTADLLNGTKAYVLAVIEHGSRRVRVLGTTKHPVQSWVVQQARNLLMDLGDAGTRAKFVLHDRDASFTQAFDAVFQAAGIRVIRSAVQAPRMNSIMERWIGSCRRELLDRTLIWNLRHLMTVLREYEDFYNSHRPHRALDQAAPLRPLPDGVTDLDHFRVRRHDRAGGVIHEYRLVA